MLVHLSMQAIMAGLCIWRLTYDGIANADVHRAVVGLIVVYAATTCLCILLYRVPAYQRKQRDIELGGCCGCVPSIGRLHRVRLRFFAAAATTCLLLFVFTREDRHAAVLFAVLFVLSTWMVLAHCHRWYTFVLYLAGACTVALVFAAEAIANKHQFIATYLTTLW